MFLHRSRAELARAGWRLSLYVQRFCASLTLCRPTSPTRSAYRSSMTKQTTLCRVCRPTSLTRSAYRSSITEQMTQVTQVKTEI